MMSLGTSTFSSTLASRCARGGVDEDAFFPSLAKVRLVALTKRPDGTRSIKPAWGPLVLADIADSSGVVTLASKVASLQARQLEATEYERNRVGAVARAAAMKRALERSLCSKATGDGTSSKVRASGLEASTDAADSDVSGVDSDGDSGGSVLSSSSRSSRKAVRAVAKRQRAPVTIGASLTKAQRRKRDAALTAAGKWLE